MVKRRLTIVCLGALLAALGVLAAACGGGSKATVTQTVTTSVSGSGNGTAGFGANLQAYRTCLQQHGVTLPQFTPRTRTGTTQTTTTRRRGGPGFFGRQAQTPAQQKAFQACQSKLPQGGFGFRQRNGNNPPPGGFAGGGFTKYTNCLKKHGVTFGKSSSGSAFQKAQAACRSLLPTRPATPTLKPATTTVAS
jgi:hypothetical protein